MLHICKRYPENGFKKQAINIHNLDSLEKERLIILSQMLPVVPRTAKTSSRLFSSDINPYT